MPYTWGSGFVGESYWGISKRLIRRVCSRYSWCVSKGSDGTQRGEREMRPLMMETDGFPIQ